ncbi:MAG TPA: hypothetical protein PKK95_02655 [Vicinamibacterales bacterium]|nr:hypothetical protein [Vicinamibacterales bacterium]
MTRTATPKQVSYLMVLLARAGYDTRWMSSRYRELGASMRERSGSVSVWLSSLTIGEASALIDRLRG